MFPLVVGKQSDAPSSVALLLTRQLFRPSLFDLVTIFFCPDLSQRQGMRRGAAEPSNEPGNSAAVRGRFSFDGRSWFEADDDFAPDSGTDDTDPSMERQREHVLVHRIRAGSRSEAPVEPAAPVPSPEAMDLDAVPGDCAADTGEERGDDPEARPKRVH